MTVTQHTGTPPRQTPAVADTPARLLRAAADYIEAHGWHQGTLFNRLTTTERPPACAAGALYFAGYGDAISEVHMLLYPRRVVLAAFRVFAGHLVDTDPTLPNEPATDSLAAYEEVIGAWNDRDHRTAVEVTTTLRAAADQWERRHTT
jgi:hypothetical protein